MTGPEMFGWEAFYSAPVDVLILYLHGLKGNAQKHWPVIESCCTCSVCRLVVSAMYSVCLLVSLCARKT